MSDQSSVKLGHDPCDNVWQAGIPSSRSRRVLRRCAGWVSATTVLGLAILPTASLAADMNKVLHTYFIAAETGFDPQGTSDLYSSQVQRSIFEPLYSYDYLARPARLEPLTATALPQVSANGLIYTIQLKKGIYFQNDPIFGGKKRELTSYDYAYSLKRLVDPKLRSPSSWLLEGKIQGLDELVKQASSRGSFDYAAPVAGIQTPDRYTLVLKLTKPDYNLPMILAHTPTAAVAREVIEKHKNMQGFAMSHPVGTGPYMLQKWTPGSQIVLKASPTFRTVIWDYKGSGSAEDQQLVREMKGKTLPQIGTIDVRIIEEGQSQWLAFKQKQIDWMEITGEMAPLILSNGELKPEIAKTGVRLTKSIDPSISYTFFNMQDPLVGGLSADKIALRRAIIMAFSREQFINVISNGNALPTASPIPPDIVGFNPQFKTANPYSVAAANLLLDRYGYRKGADGYRQLPNGKPFAITYVSASGAKGTLVAEFWKRALAKIGIRMKTQSMLFPDYIKAQKQCKVQFGMQSWIADYPDADNFYQLFYGPNTHSSNFACAAIPAFDALYAKSQQMPAGPARQQLYNQMTRILEVYAPINPNLATFANTIVHPYVLGYKKHPIINATWIYLDIAKPASGAASRRSSGQ